MFFRRKADLLFLIAAVVFFVISISFLMIRFFYFNYERSMRVFYFPMERVMINFVFTPPDAVVHVWGAPESSFFVDANYLPSGRVELVSFLPYEKLPVNMRYYSFSRKGERVFFNRPPFTFMNDLVRGNVSVYLNGKVLPFKNHSFRWGKHSWEKIEKRQLRLAGIHEKMKCVWVHPKKGKRLRFVWKNALNKRANIYLLPVKSIDVRENMGVLVVTSSGTRKIYYSQLLKKKIVVIPLKGDGSFTMEALENGKNHLCLMGEIFER